MVHAYLHAAPFKHLKPIEFTDFHVTVRVSLLIAARHLATDSITHRQPVKIAFCVNESADGVLFLLPAGFVIWLFEAWRIIIWLIKWVFNGIIKVVFGNMGVFNLLYFNIARINTIHLQIIRNLI